MNTQIKFLKRWGSFAPGAIGECEASAAQDLIDQGIAELYDPEAEAAAKAEEEARIAAVVKATVETVKDTLLKDDKGAPIVQKIAAREPESGPTEFKSCGDFALRAKAYQEGQRTDKGFIGWLTKTAESGMVEAIDSDGGFLVPDEFSNEILKKVYDSAGVAGRCRDIPMQTKSIRYPYVKESSRADGSRSGGIRAYWANELGAMTASKPTFGQIRLEVEKLYVYVAASEEILADAAATGSMITQVAADELAFTVDDAILNGSGAGQPLGVLNAPCKVSVAKEAAQPADTILAENIVKMWSRCYGRSRSNAVWLVNQDIEPQLYTMSLAVGTGGVPVYMPANGLAGQAYGTLMGRPVIPCEQCDTLGDEGDIILADFSQYLLARHVGGVQSATSMHLKFDYDQTVFRFTLRVDGQPWWPSALTPKSGSTNTLSPFVTLAAR